jgi:hypothetical protein
MTLTSIEFLAFLFAAAVFRAAFGKDCFNASAGGAFIEYHEAVLEAVLTRYSPRLIVLDFSSNEFRKDKKRLQALSLLLPYYRHHPEIRAIIQSRGLTERLKMASHIYPFNSEIIHQILWNIFYDAGYIQLKVPIKEPGSSLISLLK